MIAALLLACAAATSLQFGTSKPSPDVERALERLGLESVDDAERALGRDPDEVAAHALVALGQHFRVAGDLERAGVFLRDGLRMREQLYGPVHTRTLIVVTELTRVLGTLGHFDEAIELAEDKLLWIDDAQVIDPKTLLVLFNNHSVNLQAVGEVEAAIECLRRSLDLIATTAGLDSPNYATYALNLALMEGDLGRWSEALDLAEEGLALRLEHFGEGAPQTARALLVLGMLRRQSGAYLEAESALRRAEASLRAEDPVDALELGNLLAALGGLALAKGDGAAAVDAYEECAMRYGILFDAEHPLIVEANLGRGLGLLAQGRTEVARGCLEGVAHAFAEQFGATHWRTAQVAMHLARVAADSGHPEQAVASLRSFLEDPQALPLELLPAMRTQLGACLTDAGELEAAEEALRAAVKEFEALFGLEGAYAIEPRTHLALLFERRGELAEAEAEARAALALAVAHQGDVLGGELARSRYAAQLHVGDLARLTARLGLARGAPEAALEALELARAVDLQPPAPPAPECEGSLAAEEAARGRLRALEARQDSLRHRGRALGTADARALAEARNTLAAASAELSRCAALRRARPRQVDVAEVRATLREGEVLLALVWSAQQVDWVALRPGDSESALSHGVCASGPAQVAELSRALSERVRALSRDPRSRAGPLPALPSALRDLPAAAGLHAERRVLYVPDGPLGALPLEHLFEGGACPEVVTLPALARVLERGGEARPGRMGGRALVVGDPSLGGGGIALARGEGRLDRLPAAGAEARYVAELWDEAGGEVELLLEEDATRERLEQACVDVRMLHLATHGFPGSERAPFDAALALAAAPADGAGDWVDALTLDRLLRRWGGRLEACELVVLSACDTNREVAVGTGVYSLAGGFFQAGARAVLASLWRVDETATALLMGRFIENLTGQRPDLPGGGSALEPDAALREARTWLADASRDDVRDAVRRMGLDALAGGVRGEGSEPEPAPALDPAALRPYADPYYWSGFVLLR